MTQQVQEHAELRTELQVGRHPASQRHITPNIGAARMVSQPGRPGPSIILCQSYLGMPPIRPVHLRSPQGHGKVMAHGTYVVTEGSAWIWNNSHLSRKVLFSEYVSYYGSNESRRSLLPSPGESRSLALPVLSSLMLARGRRYGKTIGGGHN